MRDFYAVFLINAGILLQKDCCRLYDVTLSMMQAFANFNIGKWFSLHIFIPAFLMSLSAADLSSATHHKCMCICLSLSLFVCNYFCETEYLQKYVTFFAEIRTQILVTGDFRVI